jgi:hypothetical protein
VTWIVIVCRSTLGSTRAAQAARACVLASSLAERASGYTSFGFPDFLGISRWGAENRVTLCDLGVLVVEAAEPVQPQNARLLRTQYAANATA